MEEHDLGAHLMLDANAVAGEMEELFGFEMTAIVHRCAHCGNEGAVGTLLAFTYGPGTVLRCSVCRDVVIRWARLPSGVRLDMRGAAVLHLQA
jgi:hypothetical protein